MQINNKKKTRTLRTCIAVAVLLCAILVVVCAVLYVPNRNIRGIWVYNETVKYEFGKNQKGCMFLESDLKYEFKYVAIGKKIKIDFTNESIRDCEYVFSVTNNMLTLNGGKGTVGGKYELKKSE